MWPDPVTFVGVLNACASILGLEEGRCVHVQIIQNSCDSDVFVGSSLVDMCAKCGSMDEALRVFDKVPSRNIVSWNAMISGYVKCGQGQNALDLFQQMQQEGVELDPITLVGVVNVCASVVALDEGMRAHELIMQRGWHSDVFLGSSLVDMYAKCGSMHNACRVFNKMPTQDLVTWNAMIFGHVKCGQGYEALELFQKMQQEGVQPGPVTFIRVLNACASVVALEEGRQVHEQIIENGCESDVFVENSVIDMYAKSGSMDDACKVFNKVPS